MKRATATPDEKREFLEKDLYDALRWLFVAAVTWEASQRLPDRCANQDALAMFTSLTLARALYEFYYGPEKQHDDARARHFAPTWNPSQTALYRRYMLGPPANKRVFHLVYNRANHAGGTGHDGLDHLNNQVLKFAKDLRGLTEEFAADADPAFRGSVQYALQEALKEATRAADHYGIANPL